MKTKLVWVALFAFGVLALRSSSAWAQCRWDGTAPFCAGTCGWDEEQRAVASSSNYDPGSVGVQGLPAASPFGSNCVTGVKAYCCKVPGRACQWEGTAPFCRGSCRNGERETAAPPGSSSGNACWTGHKVFCCSNTGSGSSPLQIAPKSNPPAVAPLPSGPLAVKGAVGPTAASAVHSADQRVAILVSWTPSGSHLPQAVWRRGPSGHWINIGDVAPDVGHFTDIATGSHPERVVNPNDSYDFQVCDVGGGCSPLITETEERAPAKAMLRESRRGAINRPLKRTAPP
jgi:hypothetical protein